jgi:hypothetical protein
MQSRSKDPVNGKPVFVKLLQEIMVKDYKRNFEDLSPNIHSREP